jgi:hypothetical protein
VLVGDLLHHQMLALFEPAFEDQFEKMTNQAVAQTTALLEVKSHDALLQKCRGYPPRRTTRLSVSSAKWFASRAQKSIS